MIADCPLRDLVAEVGKIDRRGVLAALHACVAWHVRLEPEPGTPVPAAAVHPRHLRGWAAFLALGILVADVVAFGLLPWPAYRTHRAMDVLAEAWRAGRSRSPETAPHFRTLAEDPFLTRCGGGVIGIEMERLAAEGSAGASP